jgi:hypothetical protein
MTESATMTFECVNPKCDNGFKARIIEHKGGMNDYGSWIVKCRKCNEIFDIYIGRDVNDSSLTSGGQILGKYDKEVYSDERIDEEVKNFKAKK